jgi:site-specific DNA-methyltransferase (adenine-specific)
MIYSIYNCSALFLLNSLEDESIDLIITDPPYESLEKHRRKGTTTRLKQSKSSSNKWFKTFPNSLFQDLFSEIYRVLKNNSHFYLFCDQETMFVAKPICEKVGFKFWKPIVWDKMAIGMGYHYRAQYEFILFFEKGKRKLKDLSIPDVLSVKRLKGKDYYPTEKPIELIETLIYQSSDLNDTIVDPFMGSGVTCIAALELERSFIGCDIEKDSIIATNAKLENIIGG